MDTINTPTALDQIYKTIPDAPPYALIRISKCMSCENATSENRCGLQPTACFLSALVQLDWKECPIGKWQVENGQ